MNIFCKVKPTWKQSSSQILAVFIQNIVLFVFGMTSGFPTILIPGLLSPEEPLIMSFEDISWIGSVNLICVPIGSLLSIYLSETIGRKQAIQMANIPFVISWLLFTFSTVKWHVFVGLIMTGFSGGLLDAPIPTYIAEISQPKLRGILCSTTTVSVVSGILVMFLLGTFFPWRTVALMSCVLNLLSFTLLFFIPESPHWLITQKKLQQAKKSLAWLRGWSNFDTIELEYNQIYKEIHKDKENHDKIKSQQSKLKALRPFIQRNFLWPFSLVAIIFFFSHLTGRTTLMTYAIPIFQSVNVPIDEYYATVILGIVQLVASISSTALIHFTGKRLLNFVSVLGNGVCFAVVGTYAHLHGLNTLVIQNNPNIPNNSNISKTYRTISVNSTFNYINGNIPVTEYNWIPMAFLIGVAFMANIGIRILPWILTGEVFTNQTRAAAAGLACAFTYVVSFIVNKTFFDVVNILTLAGTFFVYAGVSLLAFVFLYFFLPETEGKTLGEINEYFDGGNKNGEGVEQIKNEISLQLRIRNNLRNDNNDMNESRF